MRRKKIDLKNKEVRKPEKQEFSTNFTGALHKIGDLLTELCAADRFSNKNPIRQHF
jgi:hypothetical protein